MQLDGATFQASHRVCTCCCDPQQILNVSSPAKKGRNSEGLILSQCLLALDACQIVRLGVDFTLVCVDIATKKILDGGHFKENTVKAQLLSLNLDDCNIQNSCGKTLDAGRSAFRRTVMAGGRHNHASRKLRLCRYTLGTVPGNDTRPLAIPFQLDGQSGSKIGGTDRACIGSLTLDGGASAAFGLPLSQSGIRCSCLQIYYLPSSVHLVLTTDTGALARSFIVANNRSNRIERHCRKPVQEFFGNWH